MIEKDAVFEKVECDFENAIDTTCSIPLDLLTSQLDLLIGDTIRAKVTALSNLGTSPESDFGEVLWAFAPAAPFNFDDDVSKATGS